MSIETVYILSFVTISMVLLNSLFNPIIYIVRLRQFRVAFIELTCRTVNITETEELGISIWSVKPCGQTSKWTRTRRTKSTKCRTSKFEQQ